MKKKRTLTPEEQERVIAGLRKDHAQRLSGYRERALRLFPHICARCGREFSGRRLKELTVHHKDHNHDNNPSDGSNWELLCLYCHDFEHEKNRAAGYFTTTAEDRTPGPSIFQPFADALDLPGLENDRPPDDHNQPNGPDKF